MYQQLTEIETVRVLDGTSRQAIDHVALEEPLEIRLELHDRGVKQERSISITMRTPGFDHELAVGFLFTEGIVQDPKDILEVKSCGPLSGVHRGQNVVKVRLREESTVQWPKLERHFYATSSCGICGKASLDALEVQGILPIERERFRIPAKLIASLSEKMRSRQSVFEQTGGLHASALFDSRGDLLELREDVGRHNALDKLIGAHFLKGKTPLSDMMLFLSGRASFELVQKAVVAGIPFIAAVGAPSSLAVDVARKFDVSLLGFVRDARFNIYHGGWRLLGEQS